VVDVDWDVAMETGMRFPLTRRLLVTVALAATCAAILAISRRPPSALEAYPQSQTADLTSPDVLLICVDTLRADHVGLYGYARRTTPRIDAFFSSGRVFESAYAAAPVTTPSIVSALTGLYPHRHGVRLLMQRIAPELATVADYLRQAGYQTAGVVSNAVLTDKATGLGERFGFYDDFVDEREGFREEMYERRAARTTDAAIRWLSHERDADRPHFLFVHYIDPHGPYRPPKISRSISRMIVP
jgi:choline-sulfatase